MTDHASEFPSGLVLFQGMRKIAQGPLGEVQAKALAARSAAPEAPLLAFDLATGRLTDLDGRVEAAAGVSGPEPEPEPARRGRPKLGVVAREVTLLPRHWDWLSQQPGGASVTLRKLVEQARKTHAGADEQRRRRDGAYRFMAAIAGDAPGFEEASRALFAGDRGRLSALMAPWPADIVATVETLLGPEGES
ncbi:DUF2239 family protein [Phenylobacterium sp.]|jgi:hypothetical protein|uniref:DUF2239 family protein n=1 Tax=Phenylobacterium sp. TaxID=1871053 RepID=UPI0025E2C9C4|nr:DUF2239 family protein [Phenylobacterium sp.]|tara:strand:- start:399 stop:974 length:576 start_codon:yes stop_codon:yes gene_type:complete